MALVGQHDSLAWDAPVDHKDIQVGPQVGLGKDVPVGYKHGCTVNLEHKDKPQEQVDAKSPRALYTDLGNHTREYHLAHSAKSEIGRDLGRTVQPRGSAIAKTTDTPPERCSLV